MKLLTRIKNIIDTRDPFGNIRKLTNPDANGIPERAYVRDIEELPPEQQYFTIPYRWAAKQLPLKRVLDAGCGIGSTTYYLAKYASNIVGIDISDVSIKYAKDNYMRNNCIFQVGDILNTGFNNDGFNAVTSFEVIEHLNESDQRKYLKEICRILSADGELFFSTPNRDFTDGNNSYHLRELNTTELRDLLLHYFGNVDIMGISEDSVLRKDANGGKILFGRCWGKLQLKES